MSEEDRVFKALIIIADCLERAALEIRQMYAEPLKTLEQTVTDTLRSSKALSDSTLLDNVQAVFPPDLAGMLYFEATEDWTLIRPREYLGPDNFRRIAAIVRDTLNGEYVSAGKESYFRVAREQQPQTIGTLPEFDPDDLMKHPWKGKKTGDKEWARGSVSWGWDFKDAFKPETISVLEKGSEVIGEHEFSLNGNLVQARKAAK